MLYLPPELWSIIFEIKEQMEYEDLWKKVLDKQKEKKIKIQLRESYEILMELHRENPEKNTREKVYKVLDNEAKKLGINNIHEKMYKEAYLIM
tara:strand:+ start:262 stop:540 length:279 start_codon:yes stop_codon:yes gene_type:complete